MFPVFYFSSGGVVLASRDGKIVFENSLDARLDVVFRKKLPEVCRLIFLKIKLIHVARINVIYILEVAICTVAST